MRGALGDLLCTEGDANYDLAKVYQSLCGYDFIIMDKDVDPNAAEMLRDLEQVRITILSKGVLCRRHLVKSVPVPPSNIKRRIQAI